MSKMKTSFVSVAMAFVLLLGGVFSFLGLNNLKAKAFVPGDVSIYYFNDSYPTLNHCAYMNLVGGEPFYEYRQITSEDFNDDIVTAEYFQNILYGALVIIDIKTFLPDDDYLGTLFSALKTRECKTAFVTVYDDTNFSADTLSKIDVFFQSDYSSLKQFTKNAMRNFRTRINPADTEDPYIHDAVIFIDRCWTNGLTSGMVETFCEESIYMDFLVDEIMINLTSSIPDDSITNILQDYNINLLLDVGDAGDGYNSFYNITDQQAYENIADLNDLYAEMPENAFNINNVCSIGFTSLESDLEAFLLNEEEEEERFIPNYVYERDIFVPGEGLNVITDQALKAMYAEGSNVDTLDENAFATALRGIL